MFLPPTPRRRAVSWAHRLRSSLAENESSDGIVGLSLGVAAGRRLLGATSTMGASLGRDNFTAAAVYIHTAYTTIHNQG